MGDKLDARSTLCKFVGYLTKSWDITSMIPWKQKVFVYRNPTFLEKEFLLDRNGKIMELEEVQEPQIISQTLETQTQENTEISNTQPLRRSERIRGLPERYGLLLESNKEELQVDEDPRSYNEAICDINSGKWQSAMESEMDSMYSNKVWTLVDPPEGIVPIGCKWIYK